MSKQEGTAYDLFLGDGPNEDPFGRKDVSVHDRSFKKKAEIMTAEYREEVAKRKKEKKPKVGALPFPDEMGRMPITPQVIRGVIPSKSNGYKIITLKSKEGKTWSSLGKTTALQIYEKSFYAQCDKYRQLGITQEFMIDIDVYFAKKQSDLDGLFKILLDCLQTNSCIKNDSLCYEIHARKHIDKENPRVEFSLQLL
jgi:Holliday junction resolvase RusA-like endonuclease